MNKSNGNTEIQKNQLVRVDAVKHLIGQANTLAALLSVIHILEPDFRNDSMAAAASIAEELAEDVAELVEVTL